MRKLPFVLGLVAITILTMVVACKHEIFTSVKSFSVPEAKKWYEENYPEFIPLKVGGDSTKHIVIKPNWSKSSTSIRGKWEFVETLIQAEGSFGFATKESVEKYENLKNRDYLNSLSRLIVLKNSSSQKTYSFIMTIVGDLNYLEKNNFELWENSYLNLRKDFNGFVFYHDLTGKYVNGWSYEGGVPTKTVSFVDRGELPIRIKTESTNCITYYIFSWVEGCTDWFQVGENSNGSISLTWITTICNDPTITQDCVTVCTPITTDTGTGPGTGPGNPVEPGSYQPGLPCPGDPINSPSIAPTNGSGLLGGMYGCVRIGTDCETTGHWHGGIDIAAPLNADLYAMHSGRVIYVKDDVPSGTHGSTDLGNFIVVRSSFTDSQGATQTVTFLYGHLNSVTVSNGSWVETGDIIGCTGNTGNASKPGIVPHVHIQTENGLGETLNPISYFATTINPNGSITSPCLGPNQ